MIRVEKLPFPQNIFIDLLTVRRCFGLPESLFWVKIGFILNNGRLERILFKNADYMYPNWSEFPVITTHLKKVV